MLHIDSQALPIHYLAQVTLDIWTIEELFSEFLKYDNGGVTCKIKNST